MVKRIDEEKLELSGIGRMLALYNKEWNTLHEAKYFNKLSLSERIALLKSGSESFFSCFKGKSIRCLSVEHEDRKPSMGLLIDNSGRVAFRCASCGEVFDIFDIVGAVYNLGTFKEQYAKVVELFCEDGAYKELRNGCGGTYKRYSDMTPYEKTLVNSFYKPIPVEDDEDKSKASQIAVDFLENRGMIISNLEYLGSFNIFLNEHILENDVRYWVPPSGGVYIVFINSDGSVCRRNTDPDALYRYNNGKGEIGIFREEQLLEGKPCFVCEGCFDALSLQALGFNAISVNGAENYGKLLEMDGIMPILLPDRDTAGLKCAAKYKGKFFVPDFYFDNESYPVLLRGEDVNDAYVRGLEDENVMCEWFNGLRELVNAAYDFYIGGRVND